MNYDLTRMRENLIRMKAVLARMNYDLTRMRAVLAGMNYNLIRMKENLIRMSYNLIRMGFVPVRMSCDIARMAGKITGKWTEIGIFGFQFGRFSLEMIELRKKVSHKFELATAKKTLHMIDDKITVQHHLAQADDALNIHTYFSYAQSCVRFKPVSEPIDKNYKSIVS